MEDYLQGHLFRYVISLFSYSCFFPVIIHIAFWGITLVPIWDMSSCIAPDSTYHSIQGTPLLQHYYNVDGLHAQSGKFAVSWRRTSSMSQILHGSFHVFKTVWYPPFTTILFARCDRKCIVGNITLRLMPNTNIISNPGWDPENSWRTKLNGDVKWFVKFSFSNALIWFYSDWASGYSSRYHTTLWSLSGQSHNWNHRIFIYAFYQNARYCARA